MASMQRDGGGKKYTYTIKVEEGCLEDTVADVIACTVSRSRDLKNGVISRALLKRAGNDLQKELHNHPNFRDGDIAMLHGYKLSCKRVFLTTMDPPHGTEAQFCRKFIRDFVEKCMNEAVMWQCQSIAFPAIGTGRLRFPADTVADQMFETAVRWFENNGTSTLRKVLFVVHQSDQNTLKVFREKEQKKSPMVSSHWSKDRGAGKVSNAESEQVLLLPSRNTRILLHFFHHHILTKLKSQCKIDLQDNMISLKGHADHVGKAISEMKRLIKDVNALNTKCLVGQLVLNDADLSKELRNKGLDVCAIYSSKDEHTTFFGRSQAEIHRAKDYVLKSYVMKSRSDTSRSFHKRSAQMPTSPHVPAPVIARDCRVFEKNKYVIKVYTGDILQANTECIVNPLNIHLQHSGGVAAAVAAAAGTDLAELACNSMIKAFQFEVGQVCSTVAGKLKYKYVLHAVGPCWADFSPHSKQLQQECEDKLFRAINNCLLEAKRLGMTSIAFPAVSAGVFGCPEEVCCMQYARAIIKHCGWISKLTLFKEPVKEIHFVDSNAQIIRRIQDTFTCMITDKNNEHVCRQQVFGSEGSRRSASKHKSREKQKERAADNLNHGISNYPGYTFVHLNGRRCFCFAVSLEQILLVYTDNLLTLQNIDMLALGETHDGKSVGSATIKFYDLAGKTYKEEKEKSFSVNHYYGKVVVCKGGQSNFKFVAHAVLYPRGHSTDEDIRKLFEHVLKAAKRKRCHSVALSLFGTGKGKADPEYHMKRFLEGLLSFCDKNKKFGIEIHLVDLESNKTSVAQDVIKTFIDNNSKPGSSKQQNFSRSLQHNRHKEAFCRSRSWDPDFTEKFPKFRRRIGEWVEEDTQDVEQREIHERDVGIGGGHMEKLPEHSHIRIKGESERSRHECSDEDQNQHFDEGGAWNMDRMEEKNEQYSSDIGSVSDDEEEIDHLSGSDRDTGIDDEADSCVICMDEIINPKKLPCGHVFCSDCIEEQFTHKKACPTCGAVLGIITGDQPDGTMNVTVSKDVSCTGFEDCGQIEICYKFRDGIQGPEHPVPGASYKGIRRMAYLPDNKRGREICAMLEVAFDRKLVFTIGRSRTTGADGVITWNDIHHKTDPRPNSQFGYPDPTYLDRVTDELKVKGVTPDDIPSLSAASQK